MANYNETDVVNLLSRHQDIQIRGKVIDIVREGKGIIGKGTRGKLDFLTGYHGYVINYVDQLKK